MSIKFPDTTLPIGLLVSTLLAGCACFDVHAEPIFETINIDTGTALSQTVIQVREQGQAEADLVVISVISKTERRIKVLSGERQYQTALLSQPLPKDVIFIDAGQWRGERILLYFTSVGADRVDTKTGHRTHLIDLDSIYQVPLYVDVPLVNLFRDINEDGLSDFVVPTFKGYDIAIQLPNGEFTKAISLPARPIMDMSYNQYPWYQSRSLLLVDMNQDGRKDIVFWDQGDFRIHRQLPDGQFDPQIYRVPSSVPFEFDGIDGIGRAFNNEDQSNKQVTVLLDIKDLDGDGVPDLVTQAVKSLGVFNKRTTTTYYKGFISSVGWVNFNPIKMSSIVSKGFQYRLELRDLNQDQKADVVVSSVEFGLGKVIRALLTSSIRIDLNFFPLYDDGHFANKPARVQKIEAKFSLSSGQVFLPFVLLSDVNGDKLEDLLVQDGKDKLLIYLGEDLPRLFSKTFISIDAKMPNDPDNVFRTKLNHDDIWDIILKIPPPINDRQASHQVVLLLSKQEANPETDQKNSTAAIPNPVRRSEGDESARDESVRDDAE